jgi:hypothetical protein
MGNRCYKLYDYYLGTGGISHKFNLGGELTDI